MTAATGRDADDVRISLANSLRPVTPKASRTGADRHGTAGGTSALPPGMDRDHFHETQ
ncbi:hypothetical protein SAMN05216511_7148 [Streptomyces sp. KS_16]|nr:hypothetical protein BX261_0077 [Streptomyces sp. 2321.6]SDR59542.1 hypothetical protein SAMN05216511_7148 [Streptomyces sp. KS_16]